MSRNPIISDWGSDVEILTYDRSTRKYVLYGRADHPWNSTHPDFQAWFATVWPDQPTGIWNTRRCVYRLESDDCLNWSPAELVFAPGKDDNLDDGHYGVHAVARGRPAPGHPRRPPPGRQRFRYRAPALARRPGLAAVSRPPAAPAPRTMRAVTTASMIECPTVPLIVGDEIWMYYGGSSVHHDWWIFGQEDRLPVPEAHDIDIPAQGHHLCLATLRLDGWVSLRASVREGFVETKPVFSPGEKLHINARCGEGGYVFVEVDGQLEQRLVGFRSRRLRRVHRRQR